MANRPGIRKVMTRAARGPLNLTILGGAVIGAVVLASWPIAAIGGAAYLALVATDVTSPGFRRRVLFGRSPPAGLPRQDELHDDAVRAAVAAIAAARAEIDKVVRATPERIQRHVGTTLTSLDELARHATVLALRADGLARYLAGVDVIAAEAEARALAAEARGTTDAGARKNYEAAATTADERLTALRDIATARERAVAHLARIASAMKGVPPKLVRLRALDDQASDALSGDVGTELETMNIDLRAFEQTLADLAEGQT